MRVIVAAVPGSGKTTIMREVKRRLPSAKIVNMGSIILEIAKKRLGLKRRDDLRKVLTVDQQREFQEIAARKVAATRGKNLLIDTHVSINTPHGYFPGLSEKTVHIMKPDLIVLLEYRPKDVAQRRRGDKTRSRDAESERQIEEHQTYNREFAFSAASHTDAAVEIIDLRYPQRKKFEHAKKAASEIVKLIES